MSAQNYLLSIDAGTGSIRAVIFDTLGNQIAISQREWTHLSVDGVEGSMGFDFVKGWELAVVCIREVIASCGIDPKNILSLSASSMREGIVVYDQDKKELWGVANVDSRAAAQVAQLNALHPTMERDFYLSSGQTFALGAIPRLLWLKQNDPALYDQGRYFTMISDWILFKLCGELACDPSNGGTAGAFSLEKRQWEKSHFEQCGVKDMFVPILESGEVLGCVTPKASQETGLSTSTLVVMGGGDVQIGTAGLGANALGDTVILGGSFWQQVVNIKASTLLSPDMKLRVNPHVVKGVSQAEGITFFTGLVMRWFRDAMAGERSYSELEEMAKKIPVGSYGIQPIFSDAMNYGQWIHAAPSFVGLGIDPEKYNIASMFRALEENACITSAINLENIKVFSGVTPTSITFASGASQGALWSQILSDVTGLEVNVPVVKEATSLGVAMAAGIGAGVYESFDGAAQNIVKMEKTYHPHKENFARYQEIKEQWKIIYQKQLELVASHVTQPMWKAPGL